MPRVYHSRAPWCRPERVFAINSHSVDGPDGYASMSFSHPWIAARVGIVIAGELGDRDREDCAH